MLDDHPPDDTAARALSMTWRVHPDVVSQRLGEAGVLIDMRSGRMFELNATGIRIWELLVEGRLLSDVIAHLSEEFDPELLDLQEQVSALIDELAREGLVHADPHG